MRILSHFLTFCKKRRLLAIQPHSAQLRPFTAAWRMTAPDAFWKLNSEPVMIAIITLKHRFDPCQHRLEIDSQNIYGADPSLPGIAGDGTLASTLPGSASGNSSTNSAPPSAWLRTLSSPPCCSTMP